MKVGDIAVGQIVGRERGYRDPRRTVPARHAAANRTCHISELALRVVVVIPLEFSRRQLDCVENAGEIEVRRRHAVAAVGVLFHQGGTVLIQCNRSGHRLRDGRRVIDRRDGDRDDRGDGSGTDGRR